MLAQPLEALEMQMRKNFFAICLVPLVALHFLSETPYHQSPRLAPSCNGSNFDPISEVTVAIITNPIV